MDVSSKQAITVVGAGAWGTALAIHLASLGQTVHLWGQKSDNLERMAKTRINARYLPEVPLPENLIVRGDWQALILETQDILLAVPSHVFRLVLTGIYPQFKSDTRLIWATKGLDSKTHHLLSEVVLEVCGKTQVRAILSGPSFAKEVAKGLPTAVVVAAESQTTAEYFSDRFQGPQFRVYTSLDMIGVQLGGALKNVIAIAVGISDGLGYGANTKSAIITRGLAELTRLGVALGAKQETFMGLTGVGDLVLTCTDDQSRNRRMGLAIGKGVDRAQAKKEIDQVVEGALTAEIMLALAKKHHIDLPITTVIYQVLHHNLDPREAVSQLLSRQPKAE